MTADFISDPIALLEEGLFTRIEQVHLQISRNKDAFPGYAAYDCDFYAARDKFEATHPELIKQVDEILSFESLRQDEISREIYWQGARDCLRLMKHLNADEAHPPQLWKCASPYKFTTSDRKLKKFLQAHNVEFTDRRKVDGRMRWAYPWSPEIARLFDEYSSLTPCEGGTIIHEDAD